MEPPESFQDEMKELDEEQLTAVLLNVVTAEPEALELANALIVRPAHNSPVDDVEFDAEDEKELRFRLVSLVEDLASNHPRTVAKAFEALGEILKHAQVHTDLGDGASAVRMLETILEACHFNWPQSRETFFATPCQQFFQDHRVAWETALARSAAVPPASRYALMRKLVGWDPTVRTLCAARFAVPYCCFDIMRVSFG